MVESTQTVDLRVDIGGLSLKNPVLTASGTFGYGIEFAPFVDLNILGGIIVKGISLAPRAGNPPPRIVETPCGMLNAIGLENTGIEAFLSEKIPFLQTLSTPVIVNILGDSAEEYGELAKRLDGVSGIAAIEVNISCPNVKKGGVAFGTNPGMAAQVIAAVRRATRLPVIVKLSPNVTDVTEFACIAQEEGADAVSLINTLMGMAIDVRTRRPKLANIIGGLSGPAIKPVALRMVWQVARKVSIPVIGIGGITTTEDALEFLIAGASAVQIGTANFIDPTVSRTIVEGITRYCIQEGISNIKELTGALRVC